MDLHTKFYMLQEHMSQHFYKVSYLMKGKKLGHNIFFLIHPFFSDGFSVAILIDAGKLNNNLYLFSSGMVISRWKFCSPDNYNKVLLNQEIICIQYIPIRGVPGRWCFIAKVCSGLGISA